MHKTLLSLTLAATMLYSLSAVAVESSGTVTGAHGNSVEFDRAATAENGQVTHTGSYTGEKGKTMNVQGSAGGGQNSGTVTGPRGKTATYSGTTTHGDGAYEHTGTVTGPRGKERTHTRSGTIERGQKAERSAGMHRPARKHR